MFVWFIPGIQLQIPPCGRVRPLHKLGLKGFPRFTKPIKSLLYWLLISSGYRTYRFLSIFFKVFYPHYDRQTPQEWQKKMNLLASHKFASCYNPADGIVQFPHPQVLSPELRRVPLEKLKDPHVAFFVQQNPGYERGDQLVCLTEIIESNATRAGMRVWKTGSPLQIPYPIDAEVLCQQ